MSSIRIISIPEGQAPLWVRKEWVGLELSIIGEESLIPEKGELIGVLGGAPSEENRGGYAVSVETALFELGRKCSPAANWFRENLSPVMTTFKFGEKFCEYLP